MNSGALSKAEKRLLRDLLEEANRVSRRNKTIRALRDENEKLRLQIGALKAGAHGRPRVFLGLPSRLTRIFKKLTQHRR